MAVRRQRLVLGALAVNLLVMAYMAVLQHRYITSLDNTSQHTDLQAKDTAPPPGTGQALANKITVIIRDFEMFDNAVTETVKELRHSGLNSSRIMIVGDSLPYPPLQLDKEDLKNVDVVSLKPDLLHNYSSGRPDHLIDSKYVLILPDAAKVKHWKHIQKGVNMLGGKGWTKAVVFGVGHNALNCISLSVDLKRWTMSFQETSVSTDKCDMFVGDQAILMHTQSFRSLANPFARPFPSTFYVQAKVRGWKTRYLSTQRLDWVKTLFSEPHNKWKHKRLEEERLSQFYRHWGIRAVVHSGGKTDYYGCTKSTTRCFGTIVDDMPEFLYEGKWTPPCCLKALRETTKHVLHILQEEGVRYWLEGGSLLGAVRHGDIIPWDYDVDIGIYKEEIEKSSYLRDVLKHNFVDEQGFVWEKATEGEFFRVQYSEHNHLHVDIHPFYSKAGIMTKNTWFPTHRQDTEFPEYFLIPLTKIPFVGIEASAPNNVKKFLEYKFGEGVIENPRFPNLKTVQ